MMTATLPVQTSRFAKFVITFTIAACMLICGFAGLVFSNVLEGRPRDRAIWGILVMALAPAAIVTAIWTVQRRKRFSDPNALRRWLALLNVPGTFFIATAFVCVAYGSFENSAVRPLIPHTPSLTIEFADKPLPSLTVRGIFGNSESGSGETRMDGKLIGEIPFRFKSVSTEIQPLEINLAGAVLNPTERRLNVCFELVILQRTHIRFRGLKNMAITCDGQTCGEDATLGPGTYKFILAGDR